MPTRGRLVLAALLLLALGTACGGGGKDEAGQLTVDGRAEIAAPGKDAEEVRGSRAVRFGERVKVLEGTAVLRLDRDRELELREGSNVVLQEVQETGRRVAQPLLLEHDLLVQAPAGARLTVSADGTDVVVGGGAQVSRGQVLVVSSYDGDVELRSGTRSSAVAALRQVSIAADGSTPARPSPLSYDSADAWDRRFLSDAIDLGSELEARSKGFSAQVSPAEGSTAQFLLGLLPALAAQPDFDASLFDSKRPAGESLVGIAIVIEGTRGTFAERWAGVFGFRDEGAQWGLVALDQGVTRVPLLAAIDGAIGRGPRAFEPVPLPDPSGDVALPAPPSPAPTTGSAAPSGPTRTVPVTSTIPPPVPPPPGPGPLNTGIPLIDNTINNLVETLSGLLRGLGGG